MKASRPLPSHSKGLKNIHLNHPGQVPLSSHDVAGMIGRNDRSPGGVEDVAAELLDSPVSGEPLESGIAKGDDGSGLELPQSLLKVRPALINGSVCPGNSVEYIVWGLTMDYIVEQEVIPL